MQDLNEDEDHLRPDLDENDYAVPHEEEHIAELEDDDEEDVEDFDRFNDHDDDVGSDELESPNQHHLPPPPGKGRIVIGPRAVPNGSGNGDSGFRRRLPAQPERPHPMYINQARARGRARGGHHPHGGHPARLHGPGGPRVGGGAPTGRALPATSVVYQNMMGMADSLGRNILPQSPTSGMSYLSNASRGSPTSAMLTNIANKRMPVKR